MTNLCRDTIYIAICQTQAHTKYVVKVSHYMFFRSLTSSEDRLPHFSQICILKKCFVQCI
jgi:hypothetical protein